MPKVVTLVTNSSPNAFGGGDGTSQYYVTNRKDGMPIGPVSVDASGTWNSVTLAIQQCNDLTVSPQVWGQLSTLTADGVYNFSPPPGAAVRCVITGSGSPIPSISVRLRGDFDGQTGT